jgi:hypothetical protein
MHNIQRCILIQNNMSLIRVKKEIILMTIKDHPDCNSNYCVTQKQSVKMLFSLGKKRIVK